MSQCSNRSRNKQDCTCTYGCSKAGMCCECVSFHRRRNEVPGCFFSKEGEATYDRSIEALARDWQARRP